MLDALLKLGDLIGGANSAILIISLLIAAFAWMDVSPRVREKGKNRDELIDWLSEHRWRSHYTTLVKVILYKLEFSDVRQKSNFYFSGWNKNILDFCIIVALFYPVVGLFFVWIWVGDGGFIGNVVQFEIQMSQGIRMLLLGLFVFLIYATFQLFKSDFIKYSVFAFMLAISAPLALSGLGSDYKTLAGISNLIFVLACIVGAGLVGGSISALLAAFNIATSTILIPNASLIQIILIIVAIFGLPFFFLMIEKLNFFRNSPIIFRFFCIISILLLTMIVFVFVDFTQAPQRRLLLLILLVVLPIINAVFDFFSIGFTIFVLKTDAYSKNPSPIVIAFLDIIVSCVTFVIFSFVIIVVVQLIDVILYVISGGVPLNTLSALNDIALDPKSASNFWIYAMIFTIFLPSSLNVCLAFFSVLYVSIPGIRGWMRQKLMEADSDPCGWDGRVADRQRLTLAFSAHVFISTFFVLSCLGLFIQMCVLFAPEIFSGMLSVALTTTEKSGRWLGLPVGD